MPLSPADLQAVADLAQQLLALLRQRVHDVPAVRRLASKFVGSVEYGPAAISEKPNGDWAVQGLTAQTMKNFYMPHGVFKVVVEAGVPQAVCDALTTALGRVRLLPEKLYRGDSSGDTEKVLEKLLVALKVSNEREPAGRAAEFTAAVKLADKLYRERKRQQLHPDWHEIWRQCRRELGNDNAPTSEKALAEARRRRKKK